MLNLIHKTLNNDGFAYSVSMMTVLNAFFTWLHDTQSTVTAISVWIGLLLSSVLVVKNVLETIKLVRGKNETH